MLRDLEHDLIQLTGIMLAAMVLGAYTGYFWLSIGLGLGAFFSYHLFRLVQLYWHIRNKHRLSPPFPPGLWGKIYQKIQQLQLQSRRRKRDLARFGTRFRQAAWAIPDGLVILNRELGVDWANPAAQTLLGVNWPNDEGKRIDDIQPYPNIVEHIARGDFSKPLEFTPDNNKTLVLSVQVTPFGKKKRQRLLVARDITQMFHFNQSRRDFVANVSHELRTPLTVISGFLESLLSTSGSEMPHRRPMELMFQQAKRMQSVIEDLLALSRIEMHDQPSPHEVVNIPTMIEAIAASARELSGERKHLIEVKSNRRLQLYGSERELHSALSNLVFNAVQHTPAQTRVSIQWYSDSAGRPCLRVEDRGNGIDPKHLPRITERFYRVDKARSRDSGGTGLGLAIVKHVLNRHQAELIISSHVGKGTTFLCRFNKDSATVDSRAEELLAAP